MIRYIFSSFLLYNFIYIMNFDAFANPMGKTQTNMYSTMVPKSTFLKRGQQSSISRSSRYRYPSTQKPASPQIANLSSSISKQYRQQTKIVLPGIKKEKGYMLEEWLNDALQGDEGAGMREPLRTLKKYQMDKASLKNSNMSLQEIGNLYSGLFVYTNGIKNTFEEMLKCASLQSRQDHKLQKTYWRIFIKLLENTIPVKTCFQIIEDDFRRDISSLRRNLLQQKKKEDDIEIIHEESIKKLKREIEDHEKKIKQMQKEYNIMNKNLQIYEETFNEEVSLRLKFEQKINQVYSSYDELKQKYQGIREQLTNKTELLMRTQSQKQKLQDRMRDDLIKYDENVQKLEMMDRRLEERQRQLTIKNQQICDLQMGSHKDDVAKLKEETELDQLMVSLKIHKKNQVQFEKKIQQYKQTIQKYQKSIQTIKQTLSIAREKNDQLYIELHSTNLRLSKVENQSTKFKFELQELKGKLLLIENKLKITEVQREDLTCKLSKTQIELSLKNKEILDKNKALQALSLNITELKSVKDKYERINDDLSFQVKKLRSQLQNKAALLGDEQVKSFTLSGQKQTCLKMINQLQITITYNKKMIQSQEKQMQEMQALNRNAIESLKMKIKERQYDIDILNKKNGELKELMGQKQGQTLKKYDQMAYLKKQNQLYEKEIIEYKEKSNFLMKQNDGKTREIEKLMKTLQGKEYTLQQKRQQIDGEVSTLKNSLLMSKISLKQRSTFIHPMIFENLLSELTRTKQNHQKYIEKTKKIHDTYDSIAQQLRVIKENSIQQKLETQKNESKLMVQVNKTKDQSKSLKIELQTRIKQKDEQIKKLITQHIEKQLESHNKIDQLSQKLLKSNNQYQIVLKQLKDLKITVEKSKRKSIDQYIQTEQITFNKYESSKINLNSQSIQIDFQQASNMNSSTRNISSSIRNSQLQRKIQRQDLTSSKQGQKLYDKIIDHREKQRESLALSSRTLVVKPQPDRPHLQQLQQQCSSIEGKQQKSERKIEGKQFKKALRLTYMRK